VGDERIKSKLFVVVDAGPAAADRLAAALAATPIASVLIRPPVGGRLDAANARPLVEMVQNAGVAALIADDAELARTLRADGVHLSVSDDPADAYETARGFVGGRCIVGAETGGSRDTAMTLAEVGADYVAFAETGNGDDVMPRDELCEWWAEIFEVPCVALGVATPEDAAALQAVRCDFIGMTLPASAPAADARDFVLAMRAALTLGLTEAQP
jgi:thiamine-phosphate pyrophosphorylase